MSHLYLLLLVLLKKTEIYRTKRGNCSGNNGRIQWERFLTRVMKIQTRDVNIESPSLLDYWELCT
eukprot:2092391-Amphidinium_carterae.1